MRSILLINKSDQVLQEFSQAIKKYSGIFGTQVTFGSCQNINDFIALLEMGKKVDMIFINRVPDTNDCKLLQQKFAKHQGKVPIIITMGKPEYLLNEKFTSENVVFQASLDKNYIFNCLRLYLEDENRKIDVRIFKEILISVVDVIFQNTKEKMTPYSVSEAKGESEIHDVSSVVAFFGEGIKGTLNISTSEELLTHFSKKILMFEDETPSLDMMLDVIGEISNQVLGVIRQALGEYGYELNSSMQIAVLGKEHGSHTNSSGHYYSLPFTSKNMEFNVTFCYDTYPIRLHPKIMQIQQGSRVLDVRLLNALKDNVIKTISSNTNMKIEQGPFTLHKGQAYAADSVHIIHGRGNEGGYVLMVSVPFNTAVKIVKNMLLCEENDVNQNLIADAIGELLNQIQGAQKKSAEKLGYSFQNIVHCSFTSQTPINYLLKNPGHYLRNNYKLDDEFEMTICYGMDSFFADSYFDISSLAKGT